MAFISSITVISQYKAHAVEASILSCLDEFPLNFNLIISMRPRTAMLVSLALAVATQSSIPRFELTYHLFVYH